MRLSPGLAMKGRSGRPPRADSGRLGAPRRRVSATPARPPKNRSATTGPSQHASSRCARVLSQVNIQLIIPNSSIASGRSMAAAASGRTVATAAANADTTRRCAARNCAAHSRQRKPQILGEHPVRVLGPAYSATKRRINSRNWAGGGSRCAWTSATSASSRATWVSAIVATSSCLSREVVVQRRLGHAAGARDLVHRRALEALAGEHPRRPFEQVLALAGVVGGRVRGPRSGARQRSVNRGLRLAMKAATPSR